MPIHKPSTKYYGIQVLYIYADICYATNPPLRYILFLSAGASTGSATSEAKSVTSQSLIQKTLTLGSSQVRKGYFFQLNLTGIILRAIWAERIGILRIGPEGIWKMAYFLVDPLLSWLGKLPTCQQHVAVTAKCRHIWPKCPCHGDTKLIRHSIFVSGIADIHLFLLRVPEVHSENSSVGSGMWVMVGGAERYMVSDNAKKISLSSHK